MLSSIERIERLLTMEKQTGQKDDAGIYIPLGLDAAIKVKAYEDCLKILRSEKINETRSEARTV